MNVRSVRRTLSVAALMSAVALLAPTAANADALTGWVGPAGANGNGIQFLNTSTIINSPNLTAQSKIYSVFGQEVAPGDIGVRARLFKSGVLCEAIDYRYNSTGATELTVGTTATCGTGSYNSHGFTAVWNGTNSYREALTFPSNPLNWTAPAARSAGPTATDPENVETGTNALGQTYGLGEGAETDADLPDLVATYSDDGTVGYVRKDDLNKVAASPSDASALEKQVIDGAEVFSSGERAVPVYSKDGSTQVGTFTIS